VIRIDRYDELESVLQEYIRPMSLRERVRNSNLFGPVAETPPALGAELSKGENREGTILQKRPEADQGVWPNQKKEAEIKILMSPRYQEMLRRWHEYRYLILERSPETYKRIRTLLQSPMTNKTVIRVFSVIESALSQAPEDGCRVSAALHVWGKLKGKAKNGDKLHFLYFLEAFKRGRLTIAEVKERLYKLAQKQRNRDLLNSRYFEEITVGWQEGQQTTSEAPSSARR
jgi:uncharacterized protein YbgA (DUF1722 family)